MINYQVGDIVEGTVITIRPFGAIMIFENGSKGLLHISEIANTFIKNIFRYLVVGKTYQVKIIEIAEDGFAKVSMSQISAEEKENYHSQTIKRTPVNESNIDFQALKDKIPKWIEEETKK